MLPKKFDHFRAYLEEFTPLEQDLLLVRWQKHTPQAVKDGFVSELGKVQARTPLAPTHCQEGRQCHQCICHRGLSFPWCNSQERHKNGKPREIECESQAQACLHFKERPQATPWTGPVKKRCLTAA